MLSSMDARAEGESSYGLTEQRLSETVFTDSYLSAKALLRNSLLKEALPDFSRNSSLCPRHCPHPVTTLMITVIIIWLAVLIPPS